MERIDYATLFELSRQWKADQARSNRSGRGSRALPDLQGSRRDAGGRGRGGAAADRGDTRGIPRATCTRCGRTDCLPHELVPTSTQPRPWCRKCWNAHVLKTVAKVPPKPCPTPGCKGKTWGYHPRCMKCDNQRSQRWQRHNKRLMAERHLKVVAYALGLIPTWPFKREYDLSLPADKRSQLAAMQNRHSIKAKVRAKLRSGEIELVGYHG